MRQRQAVALGTAAENVAGIDLLALHATGNDDTVEKLAGRAYKRLSLGVLVGARRFADEADFRLDLADTKDGLRSGRGQLRATRALRYPFGENLQLVAALLQTQPVVCRRERIGKELMRCCRCRAARSCADPGVWIRSVRPFDGQCRSPRHPLHTGGAQTIDMLARLALQIFGLRRSCLSARC